MLRRAEAARTKVAPFYLHELHLFAAEHIHSPSLKHLAIRVSRTGLARPTSRQQSGGRTRLAPCYWKRMNIQAQLECQ